MAKLEFHELRCAQCAHIFSAYRQEARYCSSRCRQAAHEARRRPLKPPVLAGVLTPDELNRVLAVLVDASVPWERKAAFSEAYTLASRLRPLVLPEQRPGAWTNA
jgi:hypothetical protein